MTDDTLEFDLADRAIGNLKTVLARIESVDLDRQSPCPGWRVRDVLAHIAGTADALADFARTGTRLLPDELVPLSDPVGSTRQAVDRVHAALTRESPGARPAAGDVAIEFTVHSWDLDPSTPIPDGLAHDVLSFVEPLITADLRQQFFAPPIAAPRDAGAGDRLVAFLGRDPATAMRETRPKT